MFDNFFTFEETPLLEYKNADSKKVFIGCFIKNKYDEDRIKIKNSLNPIRLKHLDKHMYGCVFDLKKNHQEMLETFEKFKGIDLFFYSKTLKKYNLTCEENFSYLNYGLYPVDSKCISEYMPNFTYKEFFDDILEIPRYQKIKSVNMVFLNPSIN